MQFYLVKMYKMYWLVYACTDNISLITSTECGDSKVTDEESRSFFESQTPMTSVVDDKPEEIDDADDLVNILCLYVYIHTI